MMIRDYDPSRDRQELRQCVIQLQEYERALEPALPDGETMAEAYLAFLLERCEKFSGKILVLDLDRKVVGFVAVQTRVPPEEPDEEQAEYAFISDLVVLPSQRGRGMGGALLREAEAFARGQGVRTVRVGVLAGNRPARSLYRKLGFADYQIQLVKRL